MIEKNLAGRVAQIQPERQKAKIPEVVKLGTVKYR